MRKPNVPDNVIRDWVQSRLAQGEQVQVREVREVFGGDTTRLSRIVREVRDQYGITVHTPIKAGSRADLTPDLVDRFQILKRTIERAFAEATGAEQHLPSEITLQLNRLKAAVSSEIRRAKNEDA